MALSFQNQHFSKRDTHMVLPQTSLSYVLPPCKVSNPNNPVIEKIELSVANCLPTKRTLMTWHFDLAESSSIQLFSIFALTRLKDEENDQVKQEKFKEEDKAKLKKAEQNAKEEQLKLQSLLEQVIGDWVGRVGGDFGTLNDRTKLEARLLGSPRNRWQPDPGASWFGSTAQICLV